MAAALIMASTSKVSRFDLGHLCTEILNAVSTDLGDPVIELVVQIDVSHEGKACATLALFSDILDLS